MDYMTRHLATLKVIVTPLRSEPRSYCMTYVRFILHRTRTRTIQQNAEQFGTLSEGKTFWWRLFLFIPFFYIWCFYLQSKVDKGKTIYFWCDSFQQWREHGVFAPTVHKYCFRSKMIKPFLPFHIFWEEFLYSLLICLDWHYF